jgi:uncharacterized protein YjiS (DUF1127 family)
MTTIDYNDDLRKPGTGLLTRMGLAFAGWRQRAAHRRAMHTLSAYDARLIRDVGLNPEDLQNSFNQRHRSIWLNPL